MGDQPIIVVISLLALWMKFLLLGWIRKVHFELACFSFQKAFSCLKMIIWLWLLPIYILKSRKFSVRSWNRYVRKLILWPVFGVIDCFLYFLLCSHFFRRSRRIFFIKPVKFVHLLPNPLYNIKKYSFLLRFSTSLDFTISTLFKTDLTRPMGWNPHP